MADKNIASVINIGDELLKGQVQEANFVYLARKLQTVGIKVRRVVVIPDEVDVIAKEVSEASKNYPIVFTSGGVGPTHDDLTYEAVAKGLGLILKEDERLLELCKKLFPDKPESRRCAIVPSPCELISVKSDSHGEYRVVKAGNVYVLPGSPRYFRPAVDQIVAGMSGQPLHSASLDVGLDEYSFVSVLDSVASHWDGVVSIGSYPQPGVRPHTRLTFEGKSREDVQAAKLELVGMLPPNKIVRGKFDREAADAVLNSADEHVRRAVDIIKRSYDEYQSNQMFLSFNGGKDCTVVLHLAAALTSSRKLDFPLCLYVVGDAFPEVAEFVEEAANYYGFELERREGPIRQALTTLMEDKPHLKACLLGTRKGDPGAHSLEPFAPTDPGWPNLIRVSPIIDWSYSQVWQFLLKHQVPYCCLYDEGYTSLGAKDTTKKNPLLRDPNDPSKYLPAHTLSDDSTERHGRA